MIEKFFLVTILAGNLLIMTGDDQKSNKPEFTINALRRAASVKKVVPDISWRTYDADGPVVAWQLNSRGELRFPACDQWLPLSPDLNVSDNVQRHLNECKKCQSHAELKQISQSSRAEVERLLPDRI